MTLVLDSRQVFSQAPRDTTDPGATLRLAKTTPPRPPAPPPNIADIPRELAERRQWLAWDWAWISDPKHPEGGRWTKVPKNPLTGGNASTTNPATWATIGDTIAAMDRFNFPGIGFVFTTDDPFFGIDLDNCHNPGTGECTLTATTALDRFDGCYVEWSPRQHGLHFIGRAGAFPHERTGNKRGDIECYWSGRFFTFTGRPLPGREQIKGDHTEALLTWHAATFEPAASTAAAARSVASDLTLDDEAVIRRVRRMPRAGRLLAGDAGDYPSASEADLALCNAFVAAGATDPEQIDRLVRSTPLYREKWDKRRGAATYGERTIRKALDGTVQPGTTSTASLAPLRLSSPAQDGNVVELEVVARLRRERDEAVRFNQWWAQLIGNTKLGGDLARMIAMRLTANLQKQIQDTPSEDGRYVVNPYEISGAHYNPETRRSTGGAFNPKTVMKTFERWAAAGLVPIEITKGQKRPGHDDLGNRIWKHEPTLYTFTVANNDLAAIAQALITGDAYANVPEASRPKPRGGARACPSCGSTSLRIERKVICDDCQTVIKDSVQRPARNLCAQAPDAARTASQAPPAASDETASASDAAGGHPCEQPDKEPLLANFAREETDHGARETVATNAPSWSSARKPCEQKPAPRSVGERPEDLARIEHVKDKLLGREPDDPFLYQVGRQMLATPEIRVPVSSREEDFERERAAVRGPRAPQLADVTTLSAAAAASPDPAPSVALIAAVPPRPSARTPDLTDGRPSRRP